MSRYRVERLAGMSDQHGERWQAVGDEHATATEAYRFLLAARSGEAEGVPGALHGAYRVVDVATGQVVRR